MEAAKKEEITPGPFQLEGNPIPEPRVKRGRRKRNSGPAPFGDELAQAWLAAERARGYSAQTIKAHGNILAQLRLFLEPRGRRRAAEVLADDLSAWLASLAERKLSAGTIFTYSQAVRKWFKWLEAQGKLFLNPAAEIVVPRDRRLRPAPTFTQMRALLAAADVTTPLGLRDRAILETMYATGVRREELVRMELFDLDLDRGTVRVVGKGKKERVLPLTKPAVKWVSHYVREVRPSLLKESRRLDQAALWIDREGKQLRGEALRVQLKKLVRAAGLAVAITPHALRRACATHLLQNGAHPWQVQQLLGHSTFDSLCHYLRLTAQEVRAMHRKTKLGK